VTGGLGGMLGGGTRCRCVGSDGLRQSVARADWRVAAAHVGGIHVAPVCGKQRAAAVGGSGVWEVAVARADNGGGGSAHERHPHGTGVWEATAGSCSSSGQWSSVCGVGDQQGYNF
jgi:hypothetical protein